MWYSKTKQLFYLLLVISILLRALLPTGFMPNLAAAQQGLFKITICAAQGAEDIFVDHHMQQQKPKPQPHKFCDFALSQHMAVFFILAFLSSLVFLINRQPTVTSTTQFVGKYYNRQRTPRGPPVF